MNPDSDRGHGPKGKVGKKIILKNKVYRQYDRDLSLSG